MMKFTSATGRERLLRTHPTTAQKTFDDLLHSCATTIEDALITSGLEPGVDYKAMDIFALANPLAMKLMHREGAQITVGYPDDHPHAGLRQDHELNEAEKATNAAAPFASGDAVLLDGKVEGVVVKRHKEAGHMQYMLRLPTGMVTGILGDRLGRVAA